jgi:hypothetical protein
MKLLSRRRRSISTPAGDPAPTIAADAPWSAPMPDTSEAAVAELVATPGALVGRVVNGMRIGARHVEGPHALINPDPEEER